MRLLSSAWETALALPTSAVLYAINVASIQPLPAWAKLAQPQTSNITTTPPGSFFVFREGDIVTYAPSAWRPLAAGISTLTPGPIVEVKVIFLR